MITKLLPYQIEALNKLKPGSILVGGVGSGKSLTGLSYYLKEFGDRKLYIITTAAKRDTKEWDNECSKLDISEVVVDSWNKIQHYVEVEGSFFIFDEQKLTGSGVWVKSFYQIAKKNKWILLTATPGDTWMNYIPVFVANGFYRNRTEFIKRHVVFNPYITKFPSIQRYLEVDRLRELRDSICVKMNYVRPTQAHSIMVRSTFDVSKYQNVMDTRWNPYSNSPIQNATEYCLTLRRIVNSDISKVDLLKDILVDHPKAIIFYNFDYELDILRKVGKDLNIPVSELNGHKHTAIPNTSSWIHLVQYMSGAEGWNCVKTDTLIFFSLSYAYWIMEQASGRIDRMNTPFKDLYYYVFYSQSSIDTLILKALSKKEKFNELEFYSGIDSQKKPRI